MKIGLLEDNIALCDYMSLALKMAGHTVFTHTMASSLLDRLASSDLPLPYDLLIIDLNLPGNISGQEAIMKICSHYLFHTIPIVIMSGVSINELIHVQAKFPKIPILHKPFKLKSLFQIINQYNIVSQALEIY